MKLPFVDRGQDPIGLILGFGERAYHQFETRTGVNGLCRWTDSRLDVLAICSDNPGRGFVRDFIQQCQQVWSTILILYTEHPGLYVGMKRLGFHDEVEIQGDGEIVHGLRWDRTTQPGGYYPPKPDAK